MTPEPCTARPVIAITRCVPSEFQAQLAATDAEVRVHDSVEPLRADLAQFLQGASAAILAPYDRIDATVLSSCPALRIAANASAGHENLDLAACSARDVMCTNAPDGVTRSTADYAFGLLIAAARRVVEADATVRSGGWGPSTYGSFMSTDIGGSTIGILGMGRVGRAIARRAAHGFGMQVLYWSRSRLASSIEVDIGCKYAEKAQLFGQADHVMVALPLNPETYHVVAAAEFASMRQGATFVHVGRGGVVDDMALAAALKSGQLAGASMDVFEGEPAICPELLEAPHLVLSPHIASATPSARMATLRQALENVTSALQGQSPPNLLNPVPGR